MSNKIENLKSVLDGLHVISENINRLLDEDEEGYDKGGYLSGASGYINQAKDLVEVFINQIEADALLKLVDMAKDDIENGRVKPIENVMNELREKYLGKN